MAGLHALKQIAQELSRADIVNYFLSVPNPSQVSELSNLEDVKTST